MSIKTIRKPIWFILGSMATGYVVCERKPTRVEIENGQRRYMVGSRFYPNGAQRCRIFPNKRRCKLAVKKWNANRKRIWGHLIEAGIGGFSQ